MATVMKASVFVDKLEDIAKNYKTLYVMGCFGSPMTAANKKRFTSNHSYNKQASRTAMINAATTDTFGFDCVNLIKGVLWGWSGAKNKTHGGATYCTKGVPDTNADGMIKLCSNVTNNFSKLEVGEALWCKGHIGVYIGDGLAIECTPSWQNCVQVTAVKNIGTKTGYNARSWTKHGKLPYIEYDVKAEPKKDASTIKIAAAKKYDKAIAGKYKVANCVSLHIRTDAGVSKASLGLLAKNTIVQNYGYYSVASNGKKWLYVKTPDGKVGFCSAAYLQKV